MHAVIVLALAAAAPLAPPPPGWTLVVGEESAQTHYDPASVRSVGEGLVRVHLVSNFSEPLHGATRFDVELAVNCRARSSAFLLARIYDPAGALIASRDTGLADAEFRPIGDDTIESRLHRIVCPASAAD